MAYDKLVDSAQLDATFKGIADAIRAKTGSTELISQADMAEKIPSVYETGRTDEYDYFWDNFQNYGKRTGYGESFRGSYWNDITFRPKYPLVVVGGASNMFRSAGITFAETPLQMDTSQVTTPSSMFYGSSIVKIGTLDFRNVTSLISVFQQCTRLESIEKIILKDDGSQTQTNTFGGCTKLKEIRLEGVIGTSGWGFGNSPLLSKASIESIIGALSTTTSGLTFSLSRTAVTNAFGSTTAEEWTSLIGTKPNWTINLA